MSIANTESIDRSILQALYYEISILQREDIDRIRPHACRHWEMRDWGGFSHVLIMFDQLFSLHLNCWLRWVVSTLCRWSRHVRVVLSHVKMHCHFESIDVEQWLWVFYQNLPMKEKRRRVGRMVLDVRSITHIWLSVLNINMQELNVIRMNQCYTSPLRTMSNGFAGATNPIVSMTNLPWMYKVSTPYGMNDSKNSVSDRMCVVEPQDWQDDVVCWNNDRGLRNSCRTETSERKKKIRFPENFPLTIRRALKNCFCSSIDHFVLSGNFGATSLVFLIFGAGGAICSARANDKRPWRIDR